jgi:hypothetical protein
MWYYQRTEMSRKRKQKIDTTTVEHEMHDYNGSNWIHLNSNKMFEEKFRKTVNGFNTKDS